MRVAVVCPTRRIPALAPGGASSHLRSIAGGFAQAGAEVDLWAARRAREGQPVADLPDGVTLRVARRGRLPGVLRRRRAWDERVDASALAAQAARWGAERRPDVLYERFALFASVGARLRRRLGAPWVVEVNAPVAWEAAWFEGATADPALLRWEERVLQEADGIVAVSDALAEYAERRGAAPASIRVVRNGADPSPAETAAADGPFVLGYAGTFKPWQGMAAALPSIAAFAATLDRPLTLQLWGDGPDRAAVLAAAERSGVAVDARGWGEPTRAAWHAAWVPLGPWPPAGGEGFGEPCPDRYFSPLKEAEAAAARLPVFRGGRLLPPAPAPATWEQVARTILGSRGVDRVKMRTAHG